MGRVEAVAALRLLALVSIFSENRESVDDTGDQDTIGEEEFSDERLWAGQKKTIAVLALSKVLWCVW